MMNSDSTRLITRDESAIGYRTLEGTPKRPTEKTKATIYDNAPSFMSEKSERSLAGGWSPLSPALKCLKSCSFFVCGTLGFCLIILLTIPLPVSMIFMGSYFLHDCPVQPYIPLYLIVLGVASITMLISLFFARCCLPSKNADLTPSGISDFDLSMTETSSPGRCKQIGLKILSVFQTFLGLFILSWFIAGNVWVYSVYNRYQSHTPTAPHFCEHSFYLYTFWTTSCIYILFAAVSTIGCTCSTLAYFCARN